MCSYFCVVCVFKVLFVVFGDSKFVDIVKDL